MCVCEFKCTVSRRERVSFREGSSSLCEKAVCLGNHTRLSPNNVVGEMGKESTRATQRSYYYCAKKYIKLRHYCGGGDGSGVRLLASSTGET